jgi:hypothetical protein
MSEVLTSTPSAAARAARAPAANDFTELAKAMAHQGVFFFPILLLEGGLWESYGIVVRYINRVGLGERDPFECPMLTQRQAI